MTCSHAGYEAANGAVQSWAHPIPTPPVPSLTPYRPPKPSPLTLPQGPGDMPADEVVLIYTTISISSTCEAAQVAALDAELAELEGPAGFGCAQVRGSWGVTVWAAVCSRGLAGGQRYLGTNTVADCKCQRQYQLLQMDNALPMPLPTSGSLY